MTKKRNPRVREHCQSRTTLYIVWLLRPSQTQISAPFHPCWSPSPLIITDLPSNFTVGDTHCGLSAFPGLNLIITWPGDGKSWKMYSEKMRELTPVLYIPILMFFGKRASCQRICSRAVFTEVCPSAVYWHKEISTVVVNSRPTLTAYSQRRAQKCKRCSNRIAMKLLHLLTFFLIRLQGKKDLLVS